MIRYRNPTEGTIPPRKAPEGESESKLHEPGKDAQTREAPEKLESLPADTNECETEPEASVESGQKDSPGSEPGDSDADQLVEEPGEQEVELIDAARDPLVLPGEQPSALQEWLQETLAIKPRESSAPPPEQQVARIRELLTELKNEPLEPGEELMRRSMDQLENLSQVIPDHERFEAASFQSYAPAWEELLKKTGRKSLHMVLSWLKHGFRPRFGGLEKAKPGKRRTVEAMLAKVVGPARVQDFLTGNRPHRVRFPNHASFYKHWEFSQAEIRKNLKSGAVGVWLKEWGPPEVISPMGVVESAGKLRLICNDRYLNMFLEPIPFQYEKLRDVLFFTPQGGFMGTADLKSGYFHVPVHPSSWKYFAFEVSGVVLFYKVLCFGFAQACYVFTKVMQEPLLELRSFGIPISGYIDDSFTAAASQSRALRQMLLSVLLMAALGAYFGLPKCQLKPEKLAKWLGFLADSERAEFRLAPSKVQKIKEAFRELASESRTSARSLAKAAGLLASAAPAVLPVALNSRSLYDCLSGKEGWDTAFPNPEVVVETAKFWLENLDRYNGRRWWPRPANVSLYVDASGVGYGGYAFAPSGERLEIAGTFTREQAGTSSTEREVHGYVAALTVVAQTKPSEIKGAAVLLTGDSQSAISAINRFRSSKPFIQSELKRLLELASEQDFDVVARWVPRTELSEADALSGEPDQGDWALASQLFDLAVNVFGRKPDVDLFASEQFHVADRFLSKYYCPGCAGVHSPMQDWRVFVKPDEYAWVFPPPGMATSALKAIERFRTNCLVCLPAPRGSASAMLIKSFDSAEVKGPIEIPRSRVSCVPSLRVPSETLSPAFLGLSVYYIRWKS